MSLSLLFTLTGICRTKYKGIVTRADALKTFWQKIATPCVVGLLCLKLHSHTVN